MSDRVQVSVLAALITWITVQALAGSSALSGPVIMRLTIDHGVHLDDVAVLAAWLVCMAWCWRRWRRG